MLDWSGKMMEIQKSERTKVHKCHRSDLLSEDDAKVEKKQDVEDDWEKVEDSRRLCGPFKLEGATD